MQTNSTDCSMFMQTQEKSCCQSVEELELMKDHYLSFMIVRDPLERLVSCYKDKMVTNTHWSLANFRREVKRFAENKRKQGSGESGANIRQFLKADWNTEATPKLSFSGETSDISNNNISDAKATNETKIFRTVRVPKAVTVKPKPSDIPTFTDFLEFVSATDLLGSGFSSHWVPYWRQCTPCHFKYSGKQQTTDCKFRILNLSSAQDLIFRKQLNQLLEHLSLRKTIASKISTGCPTKTLKNLKLRLNLCLGHPVFVLLWQFLTFWGRDPISTIHSSNIAIVAFYN